MIAKCEWQRVLPGTAYSKLCFGDIYINHKQITHKITYTQHYIQKHLHFDSQKNFFTLTDLDETAIKYKNEPNIAYDDQKQHPRGS